MLPQGEALMRPYFPPRPKGKINPPQLPQYEAAGTWAAEFKYNGTRNGIAITPEKIELYMRQCVPHEQFKLTREISYEIRSLNLDPAQEYWLDSELLNAKTVTPAYKNKIVLYDVLHAGKYLFAGPDTLERYEMLATICRHPTVLEPGGLAFVVTPHIWLAPIFLSNFTDHYQQYLEKPEIEGLVLKKKKACIDDMGHTEYEIPWQLRCRKPHKNYNT
jgi:ATP-dependent DNA ligase